MQCLLSTSQVRERVGNVEMIAIGRAETLEDVECKRVVVARRLGVPEAQAGAPELNLSALRIGLSSI